MKILLPVTAKIKIVKYSRSTLNHETAKIFNRENFLSYGTAGSTSSLKQMIKTHSEILGWTPLFPVNFHHPIMAPLTAKSSILLSVVLHDGRDLVK